MSLAGNSWCPSQITFLSWDLKGGSCVCLGIVVVAGWWWPVSHLIWISMLRVVVLCGGKKMQHMLCQLCPVFLNSNTQVSTEVHEIRISVTTKKVFQKIKRNFGQFWVSRPGTTTSFPQLLCFWRHIWLKKKADEKTNADTQGWRFPVGCVSSTCIAGGWVSSVLPLRCGAPRRSYDHQVFPRVQEP